MSQSYNQMIPKDAVYIIEQLEQKGHEAYVVGGCVRDMLMGREPHDWDITTSATPEQVKEVFRRTYDTGIAHGTVTVIVEKEHYEVTTYRIEGEYKDARRPESVSFVDDITLDLSRRDFTMNAIAYHPTKGFVDPYDGRIHIEEKCIRSVRDASERFTEDALRILRAVRFAAQIGFDISENTIEGIKHCRHLLAKISKERIRDEFLKICISDRPEYIHKLHQLELLQYIVPEFIPTYHTPQNHPYHIYNVAEHTVVTMQHIEKDPVLRLTMLLHDIGKPATRTTDKEGIDHFYNHPQKSEVLAKKILKDLRLDNQTIADVSKLVRYHDFYIKTKLDKPAIKAMLSILGEPLFDKMLKVLEADLKGKNPDKQIKKLEQIKKIQAIKDEVIANKECYNLKMLEVDGKDLISIGVPNGKAVGEHLAQLLAYVMANPEANKKDTLLHYIEEKLK